MSMFTDCRYICNADENEFIISLTNIYNQVGKEKQEC